MHWFEKVVLLFWLMNNNDSLERRQGFSPFWNTLKVTYKVKLYFIYEQKKILRCKVTTWQYMFYVV